MRPLVYDFGQLTAQTEEDYTKQIVSDHVRAPFCKSKVVMHHGTMCVDMFHMCIIIQLVHFPFANVFR